jgi:hypothetical protein
MRMQRKIRNSLYISNLRRLFRLKGNRNERQLGFPKPNLRLVISRTVAT